MTGLPGLRRLFRLATGRPADRQEVLEELALHLDLLTDELIAEGMDPAAARDTALRRFGNVQRIERSVRSIDRGRERAMSRAEWIDNVLGDARQALRGFRRSPGFALGTALTLGLGIGLNTAIFSVFNGILLRPLPFEQPDRLVRIWSTKLDRGLRYFSVSAPDFLDWKAQTRSFEKLAAFERQRDLTLTTDSDPEQVQGARISADLFALLGAKPLAGRLFSAAEDAPGSAERAIILSYAMWKRRFGGAPSALGGTLTLNGEPWTVVGVMPAEFFIPGNPAEVWMPMGGAVDPNRANRYLRVLGRLKPGVTVAAAREDLNAAAGRIALEHRSDNDGWTITMLGLSDAVVGEDFRKAVTVLLGAVAMVLLIACGNVATMVLGRSSARARELAVRTALGAGAGRLARLLLTEGILLGLAGGALGVGLAVGLIRLLHALEPPNLPRLDQVAVDGTVLGVAALLSIGSGILFGLVPLRRASRAPLTESLREGGRGAGMGRRGQRTQRLLVVAEMTLAVLLLSGAGLLIRSLIRVQGVDLGFRSAGILTAGIALPATRYEGVERAAGFYTTLLERARAIPGVRAAAAISVPPLLGPNTGTVFVVEGRAAPDPHAVPDADYRSITPGYFQLMNIPLTLGRDFTEQDDPALGGPVVIINATTARRYWPNENPIGARIRIGDIVKGPVAEVVGVVGDVRHWTLESPEERSLLYFPLKRSGSLTMTVLLATTGSPAPFATALRREVTALDPAVPLGAVRTMDEIVDDGISQRRFNVVVLGIFALAALALAGIGLYGVMAYAVTQRTHELGVRLALGASRGGVIAMVLGESLRLVGTGVVLGLGGALLLNRTLRSMLFTIQPNDPATLTAAGVVLVAIALLGSYLPARRAARVDPMATLREE